MADFSVVRVFDSSQIRGSCALEIRDRGLLAFDVIKISRLGGILKTTPALRLASDSRHVAKLKLNAGPSVVLEAQVVSSEKERLHVRWRHNSMDEAARLDDLLLRCASDPKASSSLSHPHVLSRDGSVDIRATLVSRSETVAPEDLAARRRTLRVLQMSAVNSLIEEVVDEAVASLSRALKAGEREALIQEAKEGFVERFDALNAEKADLEVRAADLDRARELLETERRAVIEAGQFTVSDEGMLVLERRLSRLVDHAVRDGGVSEEAERQMREVMTRLLDEEREKISERARGAHSDSIALLERKVARLAQTLEEAQHERDRARQRAAALETNSGFVSGIVMTPGIAEDDPRRALKRNLLEELVRENHWLREQILQRPAPRAS